MFETAWVIEYNNSSRTMCRFDASYSSRFKRKKLMPIYEFVCEECQNEFEELVASMKSKASPACPTCQSRKSKKKVSVFSPQAGSTPAAPAPCGMGADGMCSQGGCPYAG